MHEDEYDSWEAGKETGRGTVTPSNAEDARQKRERVKHHKEQGHEVTGSEFGVYCETCEKMLVVHDD